MDRALLEQRLADVRREREERAALDAQLREALEKNVAQLNGLAGREAELLALLEILGDDPGAS